MSGPVWIPKLYNGRNRTFFMFAYEGWRFSQGAQARYRVPTNQELAGDFSNSILAQNIYDPTTTQADPSNPGREILQVAIPEPASMAIWSLIGLLGIAAGWRSIRRRAS